MNWFYVCTQVDEIGVRDVWKCGVKCLGMLGKLYVKVLELCDALCEVWRVFGWD